MRLIKLHRESGTPISRCFAALRIRKREFSIPEGFLPYPFGSCYFTLYKIMLRCIGETIQPDFLREGFYQKTEVKWKLHQEGDTGYNQCYQNSPNIPEARQDERMYVPNPIHTAPTLMHVGILSLQCCQNMKRTGRQGDFKTFSLNIEFFFC
jgi:hypothetical protein